MDNSVVLQTAIYFLRIKVIPKSEAISGSSLIIPEVSLEPGHPESAAGG
jgi:hypothetical protein